MIGFGPDVGFDVLVFDALAFDVGAFEPVATVVATRRQSLQIG